MLEADLQTLHELLQNKQYRELRTAFSEMNEVDIATLIQELPNEKAMIAFRTLPKELELDVFAELDSDLQQYLISFKSAKEIAEIIDELWIDDAVDLLEEMPAKLADKILRNSSAETRELINLYLKYPKDSAGSIMTAEYTDLRINSTVEDAIKRIRRVGEDKETVYTCYVIDETRVLQGVVTVKDLLLAEDDELVSNLMQADIISVQTNEDQEVAAQIINKFDLMSLPVVDTENRLVGIITVDDAVDVLVEEDTEDFHKMAGIKPSERPYLKTNAFILAMHRLPWLLILMISGMITEAILGRYEAAYAAVPLLVSFIPMLTGTGGNAGSQVSTTVIRGMALGEIQISDIFKIVWREARISLLVGTALSLVNMLRMLIMYRGEVMVAVVVSLALIATIFMAKIVAGVLPVLAKKLKLDPALMAAPLITTVVDAVALIIYFNIARLILGI